MSPGTFCWPGMVGCKELMVQSSLLSDKVDHNANKHYDNTLALVYDRSI